MFHVHVDTKILPTPQVHLNPSINSALDTKASVCNLESLLRGVKDQKDCGGSNHRVLLVHSFLFCVHVCVCVLDGQTHTHGGVVLCVHLCVLQEAEGSLGGGAAADVKAEARWAVPCVGLTPKQSHSDFILVT